MSIAHIYSGNPLDRGDQERRDEQWIADMANDRTSRFLPLKDLSVLVSQGLQDGLGWLGVDDMRQLGITNGGFLLGLRDQVAFFVVDISGHEHAAQELCDGGNYRFADARTVTGFVSDEDLGIVAQARAQVHSPVEKTRTSGRFGSNGSTDSWPNVPVTDSSARMNVNERTFQFKITSHHLAQVCLSIWIGNPLHSLSHSCPSSSQLNVANRLTPRCR